MPILLLNGSEVPSSYRSVVEAIVQGSWSYSVPIEWRSDDRSVIVLRMPRVQEGFPVDVETSAALAAQLERTLLSYLDA